MSVLKSGSSLRTLLVTPERIPGFFIPPRSPRLASPRLRRSSPDRVRLLSDPDDDTSGGSAPASPASSPAASPRVSLRLPPPRLGRHHRRRGAPEHVDGDLSTRASTSQSNQTKAMTSRGFRAVLSTTLGESLFHKKPVKVTVTDADAQDAVGKSPPGSGRSKVMPVKAAGLQVMKELKKSAAAIKSLSVSPRVTGPR